MLTPDRALQEAAQGFARAVERENFVLVEQFLDAWFEIARSHEWVEGAR